MLAFFPEILRPLLDALEPRSLVEVGSESGKMTRRLLEVAREHGAVVHSVDPAPRFDVEAWTREHRGALVVHRMPSLVALEAIDRFDAVLLDGDHNWYTVLHELRALERRSHQLELPLPLVFLHDIAWPYGRRDLYYDPESIPEFARQPWARRGISPVASELLVVGGFNAHLCNALREGGPRNGVLTAVEDYLASTRERFTFVKLPVAFGLGILLPELLAEARPALARRVATWAAPEIERFLDRLEVARIATLTGLST